MVGQTKTILKPTKKIACLSLIFYKKKGRFSSETQSSQQQQIDLLFPI